MSNRTPLTTLAGVTLILASCSQQQVSDDKIEVEVLPQIEALPVEEVINDQPVVLYTLPEEPGEPALELPPEPPEQPEPPAVPDTVFLSVGRHAFVADKFPFKAELEGGVGHTLCYQEHYYRPRLVCK